MFQITLKIKAQEARLHPQPAVILFSIDFLSISLHFNQRMFDKNDSFAKKLPLNLNKDFNHFNLNFTIQHFCAFSTCFANSVIPKSLLKTYRKAK